MATINRYKVPLQWAGAACVLMALIWASHLLMPPQAQQAASSYLSPAAHASGDVVVMHKETLRYHSPRCPWALRCTDHCITIKRTLAIRSGGFPCKSCNGGE